MALNQTRAALYILCVSRARLRAGALITFIEEWQRCVSEKGREVTPGEFIGWTHRYARRTTYNHLELFRHCFPELGPDSLPSALMGPLLERLAREADQAHDEAPA